MESEQNDFFSKENTGQRDERANMSLNSLIDKKENRTAYIQIKQFKRSGSYEIHPAINLMVNNKLMVQTFAKKKGLFSCFVLVSSYLGLQGLHEAVILRTDENPESPVDPTCLEMWEKDGV